MTDHPKPSPEALAAADAICTRHGMLPGGYMRDALAEDLDAFAKVRTDQLRAKSERPKCLYCTFGEDADFSIEDLKQHIESECDFHPIPRLRKLLTAAAHALRSYEFGNGSPDLAKEIADRIDAVRPGGTMLGVAITAAERDAIAKDGP